MDPLTIGLMIVLAGAIVGSGTTGSVVAHKKNKIIAKLQAEIAGLQKELARCKQRILELTNMLAAQVRTVAEIENLLLESENKRFHLISKIEELKSDKARLESLLVIVLYFLTFRRSLRLKRLSAVSDLEHRTIDGLKSIESEITFLESRKWLVGTERSLISEELGQYQVKVVSLAKHIADKKIRR
jgi:hypothetical protein